MLCLRIYDISLPIHTNMIVYPGDPKPKLSVIMDQLRIGLREVYQDLENIRLEKAEKEGELILEELKARALTPEERDRHRTSWVNLILPELESVLARF